MLCVDLVCACACVKLLACALVNGANVIAHERACNRVIAVHCLQG